MADAKGQIAFEELGLGSLLRRWRLIVPPNQREYAWTDREVTQLLQGFAKAINEAGIYFLGTIVEPLRASHERLLLARAEARKHVRRIVAPLDEREHGDLLNRWVSFLEHRALVVLLRVPDDANAYKMFETLNDRGLRTSQADLIKNFLFSRSGKRMGEVQSRWSYMRGALESASESSPRASLEGHVPG